VDAAGIEARNVKWLAATQQMSPEERANLITNPEASQAFANYLSGVPRTLAEKAKDVMLVYTAALAWAASQGITDPNFSSGTGQPGVRRTPAGHQRCAAARTLCRGISSFSIRRCRQHDDASRHSYRDAQRLRADLRLVAIVSLGRPPSRDHRALGALRLDYRSAQRDVPRNDVGSIAGRRDVALAGEPTPQKKLQQM